MLADGAGHGFFEFNHRHFLGGYCQLIDQITELSGDVQLRNLLVKDLRVARVFRGWFLFRLVCFNLDLFRDGCCCRRCGVAVDQQLEFGILDRINRPPWTKVLHFLRILILL